MINKILRTLFKIILIVTSYILQIYIINNVNFWGANGDLILMIVAIITLMDKKYIAYITATICGLVSDILFSGTICKHLIIYLLVVAILTELKRIYKQDSKLAIIVFSIVSILVSEVILFVFNIMLTGMFANIFVVIFNIFKSCLINVFLAYLVYLAFRLLRKGAQE